MRLNDKADTFFLQITNQNLDKIPIHLFMNCMLSLINVAKLTNSILLKLSKKLNLYVFCVNLTLPFAHNSLLTTRFQTPKCLKMDNKVKIGMFDIGWKTNERVAKKCSLMTTFTFFSTISYQLSATLREVLPKSKTRKTWKTIDFVPYNPIKNNLP